MNNLLKNTCTNKKSRKNLHHFHARNSHRISPVSSQNLCDAVKELNHCRRENFCDAVKEVHHQTRTNAKANRKGYIPESTAKVAGNKKLRKY
jgi:hypothetical protein